MNRVLSTLLILSILLFSASIGVTRLPERDRKARIIRGLPVKAGREAKACGVTLTTGSSPQELALED